MTPYGVAVNRLENIARIIRELQYNLPVDDVWASAWAEGWRDGKV